MSIAPWFIHIVITYDDDVHFNKKNVVQGIFFLFLTFWPHKHKFISKNELKDDLEALRIIRM